MKAVVEKKEKDPTLHHHWYNSVGDVTVNIDIEGRDVLLDIGEERYVIPLTIIKALEEESKFKKQDGDEKRKQEPAG